MHLVSQHSKAGATNPTFQGNRVSNSSAEKRVQPGQDPPPSSQCSGQWFHTPSLQVLSWLPRHYCYMLLAQDSLLGKVISPQWSINCKTINLSQHSVSELPRQLCWAAMTIKKSSLSFCLVSALRSSVPIAGARAAEERCAWTACMSGVVMHWQTASSILRSKWHGRKTLYKDKSFC